MKKPDLIKYLVVDIDNGKWVWDKNLEHHSIAVPKMLNNLENRIRRLTLFFSNEIRSGMKENPHTRILYSKNIQKKLEEITEELYLHFYMLNDFKKKVLKNIESEENKKLSPLLSLKNMKTDGSPLMIRKNAPSLSHMYERYENSEIIKKLEKSQESITLTIETIETSKECWSQILLLNNGFDSEKLFNTMKEIKEKLNSIKNNTFEEFTYLYNSFFVFDDGTRGLVHLNDLNIVKIKMSEVLNSLNDYIQRMLILGMEDYNKSEESQNIEKAIERLKKYGILDYQDINLNAVLGVKTILELEPVKTASIKTCFKKIGEFHSNMHQKMFEIQGLIYLNKYFSKDSQELVDTTLKKFTEIHEKFIDKSEEILFISENKNIREIEVYRMVLENLLLESEPGKIYFFLNNKLHNLNSKLLSKYFQLDEKKLYEALEIIGSEQFRDFVFTCNKLMLKLREELKKVVKNEEIDKQDLIKIGITTSKTTMIDSYTKALEEILATLGTFMGNTLHTLIKEMSQNLPFSEKKYRTMLKSTYEKIEDSLNEFNKDSYSSSEYVSSDSEN